MKRLTLAHVLPDLDAPSRPELRHGLHLVAEEPLALPPPLASVAPPAEPEPSSDDIWRAGYEAGIDAARAEIESILADQERQFEERMAQRIAEEVAQARAEFSEQDAERISSGVTQALGLIEAELCDGLSRALTAVAARELYSRALQQFTDVALRLLREGTAGQVTVHAPSALAANLRARLSHVPAIEIVEDSGAEVWMRADKTTIVTRLSEIVRALEGGDGA